MKQYYYLNANNEQQGPVTLDELKAIITPNSMVWCEGLDNWIEASKLPELSEVNPDETVPAPQEPALPENEILGGNSQPVQSHDEVNATSGESPLKPTLRTLSLVVFGIVVVVNGLSTAISLGAGQSVSNLFNSINSPSTSSDDDNSDSSIIDWFKDLFNSSDKNTYQFEESRSETTYEEAPAEEVASEESSDYSEPYLSDDEYNLGANLAKMAASPGFAGTYNGMTASKFNNVLYKCTVSGKQIKYENGNYRLQYFFVNSAQDPSAPITGVALSYDLNYSDTSVYTVLEDFENKMDTYGFERDGESYITRSGAYVSGGHSGGRFYIYYYYPNAPEKGPAPRR